MFSPRRPLFYAPPPALHRLPDTASSILPRHPRPTYRSRPHTLPNTHSRPRSHSPRHRLVYTSPTPSPTISLPPAYAPPTTAPAYTSHAALHAAFSPPLFSFLISTVHYIIPF